MTWRDAVSVVGRGEYRCGICQRVIELGEPQEVYEGMNCHSDCAEYDAQIAPGRGDYGY